MSNMTQSKLFVSTNLCLSWRNGPNYSCLHHGVNLRELRRKISEYQPTDIVLKYNHLRSRWYYIRNFMYKRLKSRDPLVHNIDALDYLGFDSFVVKSILLLKDKDQNIIILDYNQVLMIHDTITSRYLTYLLISLYDINDTEFLPSAKLMGMIYKWGDDILLKHGNSGYNIIKNFESICTGVYLDNYDKIDVLQEILPGIG